MRDRSLSDVPKHVMKILTDRGYNPKTGLFNDYNIRTAHNSTRRTYEKIRRMIGSCVGKGNILVLGLDPDMIMVDYVASKDYNKPTITVEEFDAFKLQPARILAYCFSCGTLSYPRPSNIYSGTIMNCSCRGQKIPVRLIPSTNRGTGGAYTRLYKIYRNMYERCYHTYSASYDNYGARGITICKEWYDPKKSILENAEVFSKWAYANGYRDPLPDEDNSDYLTIDRLDNDEPYAPWNCRWIRKGDQVKNRSISVRMDYVDGEGKLHKDALINVEASEKYHTDVQRTARRIREGWDPYDALTIPTRRTRAKIGHPPLPRDPSTYRELYQGPRYNEHGELRDKDGFLVLDWKIDIRKRFSDGNVAVTDIDISDEDV